MADEPRLSKRAEQLLASFPVPDRDWEAQARAIEARLSSVVPGTAEDRLLAAPLPGEATEGNAASSESASGVASSERKANVKTAAVDTPFPFAAMSSIIEAAPSDPHAAPSPPAPPPPASRAAGKAENASGTTSPTSTPVPGSGSQSLSALARSVAQKAGRAQAPRDIARESLSVAAAARSQSDAIVERVRTARPAPPPPPSQRTPRSNAPAAPNAGPGQRQLGPWVAIGGLGIAAAVALWVFGRQPAPTAMPAAQTAQPQVLSQREPAPPAPAAAAAEVPAAQTAEATTKLDAAPLAKAESSPAALAASALPLAPRGAAGASTPRSAGGVAAPAPPAALVGASAPVAAAASARPAPERIVLEDTPSSAKPSAAPAQGGLRPASGSPSSGGLPDRPSTGAVQAAVGSVMGAARACVVGGVATPAQVTFGSDGTVRTVTVSGPNAGTAAASCIDAALRRARVAPFTSPSFSLMVWVRP